MQLSEHVFIAWIFISTFILLPGHWAFRSYTSVARSYRGSILQSFKTVPQIPESCLKKCEEWSTFTRACKGADSCICSKKQQELIQQCFYCAMPHLRKTTKLGLAGIIDKVAAGTFFYFLQMSLPTLPRFATLTRAVLGFNDTCVKNHPELSPIAVPSENNNPQQSSLTDQISTVTVDPISDHFVAFGIAVKVSHLLLVCYILLFKS
ncbi:hypothetical protein BJ165DRAFT_1451448 [Panaeolus papilionaceus]|nr:hypothetical protein BJ165DRAFT_1451448 [Panaeolus papilionaceus]